ncbi:MAG: 1-deoxy-D-xylulose-5-phosphate synthase [Bacteroidetes bacterium]|nr:1-deoxy-D-xylulose-5-phosphate synthase [Bacteroidota bacterium]
MSQHSKTPMLDRIEDPTDLRKIEMRHLRTVCAEIRDFLIDSVSRTGGHLGAGLGTVELAVALHYAFQTPEDRIIWDVGHQAYPHKILTGRKDRLHTIRQFGGLSGFLKRKESPYDVFGAGHATTSISAALGIAAARDFQREDYKVVSVIGDGAMTGGMAYEAMNNCGLLKKNLIVVLNDNNMSISPNVWALSNYFNELIASPTYNRFRANVWDLAGKFEEFGDRFRKIASRLEGGIKAVVTPGMLFEALGFRYFGPINGHNIISLIKIFREVQSWSGPILVHVVTQKGKGYAPAESDGMNLHGVTPFDKITGKSPKKSAPDQSYTSIFADALIDIVRKRNDVVGITAAMASGTGLDKLQREIPDKYFDVGIAEPHAVTFAAGMAAEGFVPVTAIYSTFLQRAFDQVIHDVAIQNLHVVFAIDRGGLVGADGPTHHGAYDLSYLRMVPGMTIMAPADEIELRNMLYTAVEHCDGPVALRYPRGNAIGLPAEKEFREIEIGKAVVLREGADVAILAVGNMVQHARKAAELLAHSGVEAAVVNMRFVKPLDTRLLDRLFHEHRYILTVEDNSVLGGFGSGVAEYLTSCGITDVVLRLHGIPDEFIEHGSQEELHRNLNLDPLGIARTAGELCEVSLTAPLEHEKPI